ncbi:hypothetical protein [Frigoribacterium sp. UYMn621]|uniref:hypothetical protein n=1 Tax=Frigoribacterium sp. UYMn621 TaxID=3156343 RepID=UPI003399902B
MARDQWVADMAKTKEDAREIGALEPTVRVQATVAEAVAKLKEVAAQASSTGRTQANAQTQVSVAQLRSTATANELAVATRRLAAAQSSAGTSAEQLMLAEAAVDRATRNHATSTTRLTAATAELAAMQKVETVAEEKSTAARVKSNQANQTAVSRMGLIGTAVATLIPMLVPLAAFAVGGAGALTMMGVAGVLAIVGIKREMAEGTVLGQKYGVGIQSLKGNLDELSHTSAVGMLTSYNNVISLSNAAMPMLNRQVGEFSGILGRSGGNLFQGAVQGVRVLEPLLLKVGEYVEGLTSKFAQWTSSGGLQRFASYALGVLPSVERFLGSLGDAVVHLLEALAPLGSVGLTVFTGLFNIISALPVQVLTDLIAAVTWGAVAFKAWGFIAPLLEDIAWNMGALGVATEIATGPIGWVIAGVGALIAVLAVSTTSTKSATTAITDYTAAVQADTGAIGENVKAAAAKALLDAGAYSAAKKLGIGAKDLTEAVLHEGAARDRVNQKLEESLRLYESSTKESVITAQGQGALAGAATKVRDALNQQQGDVHTAIRNYNTLQDALGGTTISTEAQLRATQEQAAAAGVSVSAYLAAQASQKGTADQTQKTTALMYLQNDAAGLLKQQLDLLDGKTISAAQAQNQFDSQIANMGAHIDKTGNAVNRATASLTNNSAAAIANQGELISSTQAAQANAQAFRDNGGSVEATKQKLIDMKQAIVDHAVALGEDRGEVQAFIDKIYQIPASIPPTKIEVDTADALAKLALLNSYLDRWKGNSANLTGTGSPKLGSGILTAPGHADGGTVTGVGGPRADSVLRRLSVGEEVIRTASASQARPFLKAFNDNPGKALASIATPATQTAPPRSGDTFIIHQADISGAVTEIQRRKQQRSA